MSGQEEAGLYGLPEKLEAPILAPHQIKDLAGKVREQWHKDRLEEARIAYVLIPKGSASGDHVELGHASKLGPIPALLSGYDLVVRLAWDQWQKLSDPRRRALLDHELTHFGRKENAEGELTGWQIRKHEVGEFVEIVRRHGLWTGDLEAVGPVVHERQQMLWNLKEEKKPRRKKAGAA